jgi:osmoprotectant transport system ATP-binding protein
VEEAIKVGDLVAVFRPGGHLVQVDPPERLLGAPADDYVRDFVGFDRGIRRLSFFPAATLDLATATVLPDTTTAAGGAGTGQREGEAWVLVTDASHVPLGWAAVAELGALPAGTPLSAVPLAPVGHTFRPDTDSLRAALDATILSRTERAVAVDARGQVLGTTSYERLRAAIRAAEEAADAASAKLTEAAGAEASLPARTAGPVSVPDSGASG